LELHGRAGRAAVVLVDVRATRAAVEIDVEIGDQDVVPAVMVEVGDDALAAEGVVGCGRAAASATPTVLAAATAS